MRWFLKNPGFELGDRDWSKGSGWAIGSGANARSGQWRAVFNGSAVAVITSSNFSVRPGGKLSASAWIDGSVATAASLAVAITWFDKDGSAFAQPNGSFIGFGGGGYAESSLVDATAPSRAKACEVRITMTGTPDGSNWRVDDVDANGEVIEDIPASAIISDSRIVPAETLGSFDPLVGDKKFTEFNSGMSDRWSGVYTFIPSLGADLGELVAFMRRLGKTDRFFAYDPDRTVPLGGVVNGLLVDGAVTGGSTRIPVRAGTADTTPLTYQDYVEIGAQYFKVLRPLEIGPEGTGDLIVWPAVRATLADGEDVITDNPKMVARITSDLDKRQTEARPVELSFSFEEAM